LGLACVAVVRRHLHIFPWGWELAGEVECPDHDERGDGRDIVGDNTGPAEGARGAVEGVKGKAKEIIGNVFDREDLKQEGVAQQDKADAQREAAQKEAEAASARTAAKASEVRQESHQ